MLKALCVTFAMLFVFVLGRAVEQLHVIEAARDCRLYKAGEERYVVIKAAEWKRLYIEKKEPLGGKDHEAGDQ